MDYFYNTYTYTMMEPVRLTLANILLERPNYQVIFCGHSLGGALAEHAALDSVLVGLTQIQEPNGSEFAGSPLLYTYGEPRIGNYFLSV